ncbi:MAG TPA: hypothetical protein VMW64_06890 [Dehalococcoidia bacterium]|nr:hypothetical protein [Dehalococcoidia bacterium]
MIATENNPQTAVEELQSQQEILLRWLDNPVVTNEPEQKQAEELLISARFAINQAEEKRKELTGPLDESKKRIMNHFRPYLDRLNIGVTLLNRALHQYHTEKVQAAEAARLTQLAQQAARIAEAKDTGEVIEPLSQAVTPAAAKSSRSNLGIVTYRDDVNIEIVSPNLVPRDLCEPSMTKIRARVKSGITDIPGVLVSKKFISVAKLQGGK